MPGQFFEFTFTKVGEFSYHSVPHPHKHGTVIVLAEAQKQKQNDVWIKTHYHGFQPYAVGWRSTLLMIILVFVVLFSALYVSQMTIKPIRPIEESIHPKISQIGALEIVLADAKRQNPAVNDLGLYSGQYNFSSSDSQKHPERYKGYQYSLVNDVREHPELLRLHTMYLHPNGTKYIIDPISGKIIPFNDTSGYLTGYCLQGKYCDRSVYNIFASRVVYFVDAVTSPVNVFTHFTAVWVDADSGEIVWGNTQFEQSIMRLPLGVLSSEKTVKEMLNPPQNTTIVIVYEAGNVSKKNHFVPDAARAILHLYNRVIWKNEDTMVHSVTSDNGYSNPYSGKFNSGLIEASESYQYVFVELGEYPYHCEIHPLMKGKVEVVPNFA